MLSLLKKYKSELIESHTNTHNRGGILNKYRLCLLCNNKLSDFIEIELYLLKINILCKKHITTQPI